jgi:hypothetical protein
MYDCIRIWEEVSLARIFFLLHNFNAYFIAEEDLPLFPVSDQLMGAVRKRVVLAREIELLDHRTRKESNREFYDKKTAKEGDFDDFSPDSDSYVYLLSVFLTTHFHCNSSFF